MKAIYEPQKRKLTFMDKEGNPECGMIGADAATKVIRMMAQCESVELIITQTFKKNDNGNKDN